MNGKQKGSTFERAFWERVDVQIKDKCWPWLKATDTNGYGVLWDENKSLNRAHRVAWRLSRKKLPGHWRIRHRCDNPPCCNPNHLFRGTQKQNLVEAHSRGRMPNMKGIPKPYVAGENNGHAKLTDEKVRWARKNVYKKVSLAEASRMLNVSPATLYPAIHRKTWRHVA